MSKRTTIDGRSVTEGAARVYYAVRASRRSPSNAQLAAITGYSETNVGVKLNELQAAGLIGRQYNPARSGRGVGVAERLLEVVER